MNYKLILTLLVALLLINCTTNTNMSPELTTTVASQITVKSAISGGKLITDGGSRILEQGICWDTITNPVIAKNKIVDSSWKNVFSDTISGLKANKTYYIRAFATNFTGTSYGKSETFTTLKTTNPTLNTTAITSIAETSATSGGIVADDGGSAVTARGVCWSTIPGATVTLSTKTTDGSGVGSFSSSITGLTGATTYYARAYATNTLGTSYGEEIFFTTIPKAIVVNVPILNTNLVTSITYTTATTGGSITSDGGGAIIARGVCWSTSAAPTVTSGSITTNGTGIGSYTSSLAGLLPGTTYHLRGYATNSQGTGYGQDQTFTTNQYTVPVLTSNAITSINFTSANGGGSITADGGAPVTARGVCWSTSAAPTITSSSITTDGSGIGSFTSSIAGLLPGTSYHVRGYATNSQGTGYGQELTFTTTQYAVPVLITNIITSIGYTTATAGGSITTDGGSPVTVRGVCWSTGASPTVALSTVTSDGAGTGSFTSSITGLLQGTTYHVRAYATNDQGTGYGQEQTFTTVQPTVPTLSTSSVTLISTTTAVSGGNVSLDGGAAISSRGVCWSTSATPTIALSTKTTDGSGTGIYTSNLTGLTASTLYYVRAYATNAMGTSYGNQVTFTSSAPVTIPTVPALVTNTITAIGSTTAVSGGVTTSDGGSTISARGVCWGTVSGPTASLSTKTSDGNGPGSFNSNLAGLTASTTYYVRAYAVNTTGTGYGQEISFTTTALATIPSLTTTAISSINTTTAVSGGNITTDGGSAVTSRGVCWSTVPGASITLSTKTTNGSGTGSFVSNLSGLTPLTTYYVRSYATNAVGTAYGPEIFFTTSAAATIPVLTTTAISAITTATATSGGNVSADGGSAVTAKGVCWSTSSGATVALATRTSNGTGTGSFISNITGLAASTTYYVRAYATNGVGTGYGTEFSFTTTAQATIPVLSTSAISSINTSTAVSGGNITADGGSAVTARGVCWSTSSGATVSLSTRTSDGTGTGSFVSNITGLASSTTYYVRGYATNAVGTAYGSELSFTTSAPQASIPTMTTSAISAITTASATSGGNITADGGSVVTARGVCWSTTSGPTVGLSTKTSDGTATGSFTSNISGLAASTTYYVRGYATNAAGTAYGNELTFTTAAGSANSTGTLTVSVLTVAPGGGYSPKNVVAIWIETNAGVFVKSLLVYANARKNDLTTWYSNSGGNVANATVGAITGATQSSNTTRTCTWDGTNVSGVVVADGTYLVCMNIADGKTAFGSFAFTKGTAAVALTPANVTGFSTIKINWVH